jgi:hypothetical protein
MVFPFPLCSRSGGENCSRSYLALLAIYPDISPQAIPLLQPLRPHRLSLYPSQKHNREFGFTFVSSPMVISSLLGFFMALMVGFCNSSLRVLFHKYRKYSSLGSVVRHISKGRVQAKKIAARFFATIH